MPKKKKSPTTNRAIQTSNVTMSLATAIQDSCGTVTPSILQMTVQQFLIEIAAPNNIYFFVKTEEEDTEDPIEDDDEPEPEDEVELPESLQKKLTRS